MSKFGFQVFAYLEVWLLCSTCSMNAACLVISSSSFLNWIVGAFSFRERSSD